MSAQSQAGKLIVIAGGSGAGKTSLVQKALKEIGTSLPVERVITYTTRKPRCGEENGRDYVFISKEEFAQLEARKFFLEKTRFNGGVYATPSTLLEKLQDGISQIAIVDLEGIRSLKKAVPGAIIVWIEADSEQTLRKRLLARRTEDDETIARRIKLSLEQAQTVRSEKLADTIIINKTLEDAVKELVSLIRRHVKPQANPKPSSLPDEKV